MAGEMPETVRLIDEDGILKFPAEQVGTEYVLASTHQRTLEALREMRRYLPIIEAAERDAAVWNRITAGTGIATANGYRAALARIKEATDAPDKG